MGFLFKSEVLGIQVCQDKWKRRSSHPQQDDGFHMSLLHKIFLKSLEFATRTNCARGSSHQRRPSPHRWLRYPVAAGEWRRSPTAQCEKRGTRSHDYSNLSLDRCPGEADLPLNDRRHLPHQTGLLAARAECVKLDVRRNKTDGMAFEKERGTEVNLLQRRHFFYIQNFVRSIKSIIGVLHISPPSLTKVPPNGLELELVSCQ